MGSPGSAEVEGDQSGNDVGDGFAGFSDAGSNRVGCKRGHGWTGVAADAVPLVDRRGEGTGCNGNCIGIEIGGCKLCVHGGGKMTKCEEGRTGRSAADAHGTDGVPAGGGSFLDEGFPFVGSGGFFQNESVGLVGFIIGIGGNPSGL